MSALAAAEPAAAHVQVSPSLVEQGEPVSLRVELPRLRPGTAPVALEVEAPGLEVLEARLEGAAAGETAWRVRARVVAEPGRVPLILRAVFADGGSVELDEALTVVPAPSGTSSFPWVELAAAGAVLLAAVLLAGLWLRRNAC